jgi:DNA-binding CsgD family transcriptional regulator
MQKLPIEGFELEFEIQLLQLGMTRSEVSKELGISLPTLKQRIKDAGKLTIDNVNKLKKLGFNLKL